MTLRRIVAFAAPVLCCLCADAQPGVTGDRSLTDRPERPNLLVIMTDDQGAWAEAGRDARVSTPNLDYLARRGVRFDNAIAPTPVCSAARASFYTGRTASQHGVHDFLSEDASEQDDWLRGEFLLSEMLSRQGYRVALFGKWHADTRGWKPVRGFDRWLSYDEREVPWINQYLHTGTVHFSSNGNALRHTGVQAQFLTTSALTFIDEPAADRPFAVFINYVEPHFPFADLPERLVERYRGLAGQIVPFGDFSSLPSPDPRTIAPGAHAESVAQYLAAVTLVDEQVGRLIDGLVGGGRWEDTLVIFTSDHGHMTGQLGLYGKGNATVPQNLYELSLRIPLIVAGTERLLVPGQRRAEPVNLMDIFPTLAALTGFPLRGRYDGPGRSLLPLLRAEAAPDWRRFHIAEMGNARAISNDRWKLVRYHARDPAQPPRDRWYDLASPIGERVESSAPPKEVVSQLTQALEAYFQRYSAPGRAGDRVWDLPRPNDREPWFAESRARFPGSRKSRGRLAEETDVEKPN